MFLLDRLFTTLVRCGRLTVTDASGTVRSYGAPVAGLKPVAIRFTRSAAERRVVRNPALGFGEAYMDGGLVVEEGDVRDLLDLIGSNIRWEKENPVRRGLWRPLRLAASLGQPNRPGRARRNAAHHYDLSERLFRLFLDDDLQYSCAYFTGPQVGLDEAQAAKKAHIAAKLRLEPGQRVLDIGCGWGGLAIALAQAADVRVVGTTLSSEQLAIARARAAEAGLSDRVEFELADYRGIEGIFDRIVSVGMFEHVGRRHYRGFFDRCRALLAPDGVMLLHTIGRADGPGATDAWLAKYIFPGGYIPALSEIATALEKSWLWLTDLEVLQGHYARTLSHWYERATAAREEIAALYDERFFRMWQYYLAGGISAFRHDAYVVFQLQIARSRDALPPTRNYIAGKEAELRGRMECAVL